ncbi:S-adenosyl-L-methionine-dependent methyltransferase [Colletotrichum godetiae]|uniref:S-adenosyl-L-methionine-dependent methyltransferase n=1 Tax=Colletotrichum godetiae TaxID=1209918 RepID=A0AAJ0A859_9PEZI|nr:S-adenosyl-L-methionine-dependent methyltransferase [Colletotrichum godetiae]KAK1656782.1 S-adenosyl-L-methionine-dependent methyltransferase [Colletotrichum godetiae]
MLKLIDAHARSSLLVFRIYRRGSATTIRHFELPSKPLVYDDSLLIQLMMHLPSMTESHIPSSSYTASWTSSVVDYPEEYGRTYHAFRAGSYNFPNDEREMDRLYLTHTMIVKTIGNKFFLAPIKAEATHRILDVGTVTGISIKIVDLFPNSEIFGNDLSPIQPEWVPPNVKFEIDDVESEWVVSNKYDFIFTITDLLAKNLAPKGWAEFQDMSVLYACDDGTLTEEHAIMKRDRLFIEACKKLGREDSPGPKLEGWVRQAPFKNAVHRHFKIPLGPWSKDAHNKDLGWCKLARTLEGLDAFTLKLFIGVLGWTREEVVVLLAQVRQELKSGAFHAYLNYHAVYGQKL